MLDVFPSRFARFSGRVLALGLALGAAAHAGAPADPLWQDVRAEAIAARGERWATPASGRVMALDFAAFAARLADAPREGTANLRQSAIEITLPMADGQWQRFRVAETAVMAPELAARYPEIRTYAGQGVDDPAAGVRLDVNPRGVFAQVLAPGGDTYIDPWQAGDNAHYVVYTRAGAGTGKGYRCLFEDDARPNFSPLVAKNAPAPVPKNPSGTSLRVHRIAMLVSQNYTNSYGGTVSGGLSGIVTTVNRLTGIYERDVAVRFQLVADNDRIVYTTANPSPVPDPPGNFGAIQATIDSAIGAANYDIGHMMGANGGGGAVTPLGNVCGAFKAQGYTSLNPPRGDVFDVDFVAHELGHQYGARHTWNGSSGSCSASQWASVAAMEPGSGSTIMGYAGICSGQNLQPNSDAYFHSISFTEIFNTITNGGPGNGNQTCGTVTPSGNTPPSIGALAPITIPERTPFELTATATDPDAGDVLTYAWENTDLGARGAPSTTGNNGTAPLFRSFNPTTSPTRVFPSLRYILNNANVPPATITLPPASGTYVPGEILPDPPSGSRVMNFRVTVRDNRAGAGGVRHAATTVTAVSTAGPFRVNNISGPWTGGATETVTWDVAGTTAAPVNTSTVNILLSTDGGYTFAPLVTGTANDGSETVTVPSIATTQARIRVEANDGAGIGPGNRYFDITDASFTINASGTPITLTMGSTPILVSQGGPAPAAVTIATVSGGTPPYTLSAQAQPPEPEITVSGLAASGTSIAATATATCKIAAPNAPAGRAYPHVLRVTDGAGRSASGIFNVNVTNNTIPTLGAYANTSLPRGQSTTINPGAPPADANGNLLALEVAPTTLPGGGSVSINPSTGAITATATGSTTVGPVTIRARAVDSCGASAVQQFTLTITTPDPLLELATATVTSGNGRLDPNECNTVEVAVRNIGGSTASAVSGTLATATSEVSVATATRNYGDIAPGATRTTLGPFRVSTGPAAACGTLANFTHTLTYTGPGSPSTLSFALPIGPQDPGNYTFASSTGTPALPGSTFVTGSDDDEASVVIPIPGGFTFNMYGQPITSIAASTNGVLQFNSPTSLAGFENTALPAAGILTPAIFAMWSDWDARAVNVSGGGIYTALSGTAPNRRLDIEWRTAPWRADNPGSPLPAPTARFTVRLYEGSSRFDIQYGTLSGPNGSQATVGVQFAPTGTSFTQFLFNQPNLVAGQRLDATLVVPPCPTGPGVCGPLDELFADGFE